MRKVLKLYELYEHAMGWGSDHQLLAHLALIPIGFALVLIGTVLGPTTDTTKLPMVFNPFEVVGICSVTMSIVFLVYFDLILVICGVPIRQLINRR